MRLEEGSSATGPEPLRIGRGTGCTLREMKKALSDYLKRKKVPNRQWKTLEQKRRLAAASVRRKQ
jgi:hypothetical protein